MHFDYESKLAKIFYIFLLPYNLSMRFVIRARIPTEAGNKMVKDPNFLKNLEEYMNKAKPEASYFFEANGERVMVFITEIQTNDQIPALAEPLFQGMGANVEFHPVMSFDDLKKAISRM
jgi:hypothetical protein